MINPNESNTDQEKGNKYPVPGYSQLPYHIPQQSPTEHVPSSAPKANAEKDESEPTFRVIGFILTSGFLLYDLRLFYNHLWCVYMTFSSDFEFSNISAAEVALVIEVLKYALIAFNLGKVLVVKKCAAGFPDHKNVNPLRWALNLAIINFFLNLYISRNYLAHVYQNLLFRTIADLLHISFYVTVYSSANFKTNFLRVIKPWEYDD